MIRLLVSENFQGPVPHHASHPSHRENLQSEIRAGLWKPLLEGERARQAWNRMCYIPRFRRTCTVGFSQRILTVKTRHLHITSPMYESDIYEICDKLTVVRTLSKISWAPPSTRLKAKPCARMISFESETVSEGFQRSH